MKKYTLIFLLSLCTLFISNKSFGQTEFKGTRTVYIVRHAEKDTGSNPAISIAGKKRAGDLYRTLRRKHIELIMASQFRRTGMTADSLRLYNKIDSIQYTADANGDKFYSTLLTRAGKAKNILVVGHSNTLPSIVRKLGVSGYTVKELPETEFDNLFIVKIKKGKATLVQKKFGVPSK